LNRLKNPNVQGMAFGYAAPAIRKLNAIKSRFRPDPRPPDREEHQRSPSSSNFSVEPTGLIRLGQSTAGTTCSRIYRCAHIVAGERGRYTITIVSTPRSMQNPEAVAEQPDEPESCGSRLSHPSRPPISFRASHAVQTSQAGFPVEYLVMMREGGACRQRTVYEVGTPPRRSSSGLGRSRLAVPTRFERGSSRHRHRSQRRDRTLPNTSKERRSKASATVYLSKA
jgi:hypothetical protein